jgi:hypothetical protein
LRWWEIDSIFAYPSPMKTREASIDIEEFSLEKKYVVQEERFSSNIDRSSIIWDFRLVWLLYEWM